MAYTTGTRAYCDDIKASRDKLIGPPVKGFHMGGGRHCDMPDTWDGVGKVPPGWSGADGPEEHPDRKGEWSVELPSSVSVALADSRQSRVTPAEKTTLQTAMATAVEKDAWIGAAAEVSK